jgi:hypothetical protein
MVAMHELAQVEADTTRPNLELVQEKRKVEDVVLVRCPSCGGLRGTLRRYVTRYGNSPCPDCRAGHVVHRTQFHNFWLERFSREECVEMGRAIWEGYED